MKNFFQKVSSLIGTKKVPIPMLIMIPAIIFSFFIYTAGADNALITTPETNGIYNEPLNITWNTDSCETDEKINISYSQDSFTTNSENIASDVTCSDGTYPWLTSSLPDGDNYQVRLYRKDGSEFDTTGEFTIDNTAPEIIITDGTETEPVQIDTISYTINASLSDVTSVGYAIKIANENCNTLTYTPITGGTFDIAGNHTTDLCMKATDNAGNTSYQNVGTLNTDNTLPIISIIPASDSTASSTTLLKISIEELNLDRTAFVLSAASTHILPTTEPELTNLANNTNWVNSITYSKSSITHTWIAEINTLNLDEGINSFRVIARDFATNETHTAINNYLIDNTAPTTSAQELEPMTMIVSPNPWSNTPKTITLTCDDSKGSVEVSGCREIHYKWNNETNWTIFTGDTTTTSTPEGENYLEYFSIDNAGNIELIKSSDSYFIDTTLPEVNAGDDIITNLQFTTDVTTNDTPSGIASYLWTYTGPGTITFGNTNTKNTSIETDTDGSYTITLRATDNTGNTNSDSFTLIWDNINPTLSISPATQAKVNDLVTINLSSTDANLDRVDFTTPHETYPLTTDQTQLDALASLRSEIISITYNESTDTWTGIIDSTLLSDGDFTFSAQSFDKAGNTSNLETLTYIIDNTIPSIQVTPASETTINKTTNITITASDSTIDKIDFTIPKGTYPLTTDQSELDYLSSITNEINSITYDPTLFTWTIEADTTQLADGNFTFQLQAHDQTGNQGTLEVINYTIDNTAPIISNVNISSDNVLNSNYAKVDDTITITFETDEQAKNPIISIAGNSNSGLTAITGGGGMGCTSSGVCTTSGGVTYPNGLTIHNTNQTNWTATYIMQDGDTEGDIDYTIDIQDLVGNDASTYSNEALINFDNTAPIITITNTDSNNPFNTKLAKVEDFVIVNFSVNEDINLGLSQIAGHNILPTSTDLRNYTSAHEMLETDNEGLVNYEFTLTDLAGNPATTSLSDSDVVFDKTNPKANLISISSNNPRPHLAKTGDTVELEIIANENIKNLNASSIIINGKTCDSVTQIITSLPIKYIASLTLDDTNSNGPVTFAITMEDSAGNINILTATTDSSSVLFDKIRPDFTNLTPSNGSNTSDTTPLIGANFLEEGSGIYLFTGGLEIDGIDVSSFTFQDANGIFYQPTAPLSDGIHTATIRVTDNARNSNYKTWQFEVSATTKSLSVTTNKTQVFADGTSQAKITAQALDAGTPVSSGEITFESSIGSISTSPVTVDSEGKAVTYITSSEVGNAIITASYNFSGEIKTNTTEVKFIDTIKTLAISATPNSIIANNTDTATISVTILENGTPLTGESVTFNTTLGTLQNTTDTTTELISSTAGTATVTATYNDGSNIISDSIQITINEAPVADTTAPTATTNPADDAQFVPTSIHPIITFSELMNETTLTSARISLKKIADDDSNNDIIPSTLTIESTEGITTVTIIPDTKLEENTQYYYFLGSGIKDLVGNEMETWYAADKNDHEFTTKGNVTSFDIPLQEGWNLISLPLIPNDSNIASILDSIQSELEIIKHYDASEGTWSSFTFGGGSGVGDLDTMEDGKGYWIKLVSDSDNDTIYTRTLHIEGKETVEAGTELPRSYHVEANSWNLIGFKSAYEQLAGDYISQIGTDDVIWEYNQGYSSIYNNIKHDGTMKAGYGYWLYNHGFGYDIIPVY